MHSHVSNKKEVYKSTLRFTYIWSQSSFHWILRVDTQYIGLFSGTKSSSYLLPLVLAWPVQPVWVGILQVPSSKQCYLLGHRKHAFSVAAPALWNEILLRANFPTIKCMKVQINIKKEDKENKSQKVQEKKRNGKKERKKCFLILFPAVISANISLSLPIDIIFLFFL